MLEIECSSMVQLTKLPPLSIYLHFPWCVRKCPYCDFNSHEKKSQFDESQYISALIQDLHLALPLIENRPIHSIFMGGGTPSLFSAKSIEKILCAIDAHLSMIPDAEITLEANPGTVEAAQFKDYRAIGINRLSIGIQSFSDQHLQLLGRIHSSNEAKKAIALAHQYFDNFNIDIMYALPQQDLSATQTDIVQALQSGAPHISAYQLTLEPHTLFHRYPPQLPDEDIAMAMQHHIESQLAQSGYAHYEVSAFAKKSYRARHNLNYWQFGDYLGLGAGAHSKISSSNQIIRQMRYKQPAQYFSQINRQQPVQTEQSLEEKSLPFEFMMNALRLVDGFALALFTECTGLPASVIAPQLNLLATQGFIHYDEEWVKPTLQGQRFLNTALEYFLPN